MLGIMNHNTPPDDRYWDLDALRGIAVISMVVFHLTFDLGYFGLISPDTVYKPGWVVFQQMIAGTFIFVAGAGFDLCHGQEIKWRNIKKRVLILGSLSALISIVTFIIFGEFWIKFGILHCILAVSLISILTVGLSTSYIIVITALLIALYIYLNPPVEIPSSFDFIIKTPPATFYIKEKLKLKSGSSEPGRNIVKSITKKQLEEIAKKKMEDLNAHDLDEAAKIIAGSARSMGIEVKD